MGEYIKSKNPKTKYKFKKPDYSYSKREVILVVVLVALIVIAGGYAYWVDKKDKDQQNSINSFEDCARAGNPIMESYPERCIANDIMYVKQY